MSVITVYSRIRASLPEGADMDENLIAHAEAVQAYRDIYEYRGGKVITEIASILTDEGD